MPENRTLLPLTRDPIVKAVGPGPKTSPPDNQYPGSALKLRKYIIEYPISGPVDVPKMGPLCISNKPG